MTRKGLDFIALEKNRRRDGAKSQIQGFSGQNVKFRRHCCEFSPRVRVDEFNGAVADIQDGRVSEIRTILETSEKFVAGEIQLVIGVSRGLRRKVERKRGEVGGGAVQMKRGVRWTKNTPSTVRAPPGFCVVAHELDQRHLINRLIGKRRGLTACNPLENIVADVSVFCQRE